MIRTYNSQDLYDGPFGIGWSSNLFQNIVEKTDNTVKWATLRHTSGSRWEHLRQSNGSYISTTKGIKTKLEKKNGEYELKPNATCSSCVLYQGNIYRFSSDGSLKSITDNNGNRLSFAYSDNKLKSVTDDAGRSLTFEYYGFGKIKSMTDPAGGVYTYSYEITFGITTTEPGPTTGRNYLLASVTDPLQRKTRYTYENHTANLISVVDPMGRTALSVSYDESDRVRKLYEYNDHSKYLYYPDENKTIKVKNGISYTYEYDEFGYLLNYENPNSTIKAQEVDDGILFSKTDINGNMTIYKYDDRGNVILITEGFGTQLERKTSYEYDEELNVVTKVTDPIGREVNYEYDKKGNKTKISTPMDIHTLLIYDDNGDLTGFNGPLLLYWHFSYDKYGNVIKAVWAEKTVEMEYDILGNITSITDPNGNVTKYEYDAASQLVRKIDPYEKETIFEYDKNGNISKVTNALGYSTSFLNIEKDKLRKITDPLGNETLFIYGKSGSISMVIDAEGNSTKTDYNDLLLPVKVIDAMSNETQFCYDEARNLSRIVDPKNNETKFEYDLYRRLTKIIYPDLSTEIYTYDLIDNLVAKTNRNGNTIEYRYDELDRLVKITYPDQSETTFVYNDLNLLLYATNEHSIVDNYYDIHGYGELRTSIQNGKSVGYEYDLSGNMTKLIYPDGSYLTYSYDKLNRLDQIKDESGNVIADYTFDDIGRRTQLDRLNGITTTYQYDAANRLINNTSKVSSSSVIITSNTYAYDKVGNITLKTTLNGEHKYFYDNLYQITEVDYPDGYPFTDMVCGYDALGNRISTVNGGIVNYSSNILNQYLQANDIEYAYDQNGNLTSDGTNTYSYDDDNQLINIVLSNETKSFLYDPLGRQVKMASTAESNEFIHKGFQKIAEYSKSGDLTKKFVFGVDIDELVKLEYNNNQYYYIVDHLGSVEAMTGKKANVIEEYYYDVFGNSELRDSENNQLPASNIGNSRLFAGREFDTESLNYYHRFRYYHSRLGRYQQADSLFFSDSLNLYSYVGNNPVNKIDPFGLWSWTLEGYFPDIFIGGAISFGINPKGGLFVSARIGIGIGGGIYYDPKGSSPGWDPCQYSAINASIGIFGGGALAYGPFSIGSFPNAGLKLGAFPFRAKGYAGWGFGSPFDFGLGLRRAVSAGIEISVF